MPQMEDYQSCPTCGGGLVLVAMQNTHFLYCRKNCGFKMERNEFRNGGKLKSTC